MISKNISKTLKVAAPVLAAWYLYSEYNTSTKTSVLPPYDLPPPSSTGSSMKHQVLPFPEGYDYKDPTLNLMRSNAISLFQAMDNPKHPCNPLNSANARIIKTAVKPNSHGDKLYTMWISDGTRTCGLEMLHSLGKSGNTFVGDFLQRFYLDSFQYGYTYKSDDLNDVITRANKRYTKANISDASREIVLATLGESFFDKTIAGPAGTFNISDGYSPTIATGGGGRFTQNIVRASLRRTDMAHANLSDPTLQNKILLYLEAAPQTSINSFTVVYFEMPFNGFDPARYGSSGRAPGANIMQDWMRLERARESARE